jgi:peptidoglycan/xylan/chitin deacetylase (PgdA/CDA1 family)
MACGVQMTLIKQTRKIQLRFVGAVAGWGGWRLARKACKTAGFWGLGMEIRSGLLAVAFAAAIATPLVSPLAWSQVPAKAPGQIPANRPTQMPLRVSAQAPGAAGAAQPASPQSAQDSAPQADTNCPGHPDALGTSRVLGLDPAQYPRIGRMQYPDSLPLGDKEVVLTFDDGPLPPYSNEILDILASQCVKATYFLVGEMARAFPATVRRIYEEGHTIGTHSEDHPTRFGQLPVGKIRREIDWGISDVSAAMGDAKYLAPFFRIPSLARSDIAESELAARGLTVFSSDTVADDWHHHITPSQIIALAMRRLEARGKGILLLHDIHPTTVAALPGLLKQLKESGFHIVQVVPAASYEIAMATKPEAPMLASAPPDDEAMIDNDSAPPSWPQASANSAADDSTLPVPDASAFEPDAVPSDDTADVQWPAQPEIKAETVTRHARSEKSRRRVARAAKEERRAERPRAPARTRPHRR